MTNYGPMVCFYLVDAKVRKEKGKLSRPCRVLQIKRYVAISLYINVQLPTWQSSLYINMQMSKVHDITVPTFCTHQEINVAVLGFIN